MLLNTPNSIKMFTICGLFGKTAIDKEQLSAMELTLSAQLSKAAFDALQNTKSGGKVHGCAASVTVAYTNVGANKADIKTAIAAVSTKLKWLQSLPRDEAAQSTCKGAGPRCGDRQGVGPPWSEERQRNRRI
jgi:hypothetical protein